MSKMTSVKVLSLQIQLKLDLPNGICLVDDGLDISPKCLHTFMIQLGVIAPCDFTENLTYP